METTRDKRIAPERPTAPGDAAQMRCATARAEFPIERGASQLEPTQAVAVDADGPTYYGVPMLKEPVWVGAVPLYFFIGGAAGAASTLSCMARLFGGRDLDGLARKGRLVAALGDTVGAGLFIYNLGRPMRFLNMLRVLNPRSPMSVARGCWPHRARPTRARSCLQNRRGFLGAVGTLLDIGGGVLGMPLSGYTAVLLANTAVPVWREGRRSLPLLFMASGVAAAGSILSLAATSDVERRAAERYAVAGRIGELAATWALHREVGRSPRVARPLRRGASGALLTAATALTAASLMSSLVPRPSRRRARRAAVLGVLGSLALRFAIHHRGQGVGARSAGELRAAAPSARSGSGHRRARLGHVGIGQRRRATPARQLRQEHEEAPRQVARIGGAARACRNPARAVPSADSGYCPFASLYSRNAQRYSMCAAMRRRRAGGCALRLRRRARSTTGRPSSWRRGADRWSRPSRR